MSIHVIKAYGGDRDTVILADAIDQAREDLYEMLQWKRLSRRASSQVHAVITDLSSAIDEALNAVLDAAKDEEDTDAE